MSSKACGYGTKAAAFIAANFRQENSERLTGIVGENISLTACAARVIQQLGKNNIITSIKRIKDGFAITKNQAHPIGPIAFAISSNSIYKCQKTFQFKFTNN